MSATIPRNDPCPCGSGKKFKRCCLSRLDALVKLQNDDERVGCALLDWACSEHEETLGELLAKSGALALRHRLSRESQQLRVTWAITDATPSDGGPPLAVRYAERTELDEHDREIAERLARAHLNLYRVSAVVPKLWVELEALGSALDPDGTGLRIFSDKVSNAVTPGQTCLARVLEAEGLATFWGPVCGYPADAQSKLRAFFRGVDLATAAGSLQALEFNPDGYAPPLPDGLALRTAEWGVDDDAYVCEQLEDSGRVASLGIVIGDAEEPWAFAWPGHQNEGAADLGGWERDDAGMIEVARMVVHRDRLIVSSTSAQALTEVGDWLVREIDGLVPPLLRAA